VATGAAWLKGRNSQGGREDQKHPYRKKKRKNRKTHLTHTGLLMEGVIAIPPQFAWAYGFAEGLAGVKLEGKCGFINRDGKFVVPPTFQDVRFFNEDLAAVEKNSKWGYIDKQGNVVVEPRFENNALPFRGGIAQVRLWGGETGYINKSGEYVWKPTQ